MHPDLNLQELQILIAASQVKAGQTSLGAGDPSRLLDRGLMALGPGGVTFILPAGTAELMRRKLIK